MGIEGEKRLTQSLMSFLGSLWRFLGQGSLTEHVGGLKTIEQMRMSAEIGLYIKCQHLHTNMKDAFSWLNGER